MHNTIVPSWSKRMIQSGVLGRCDESFLDLNVTKTIDMIIDFKK